MSSNTKPKKPNKTSRPSSRKMNQNQQVACDGVYGNPRLVFSLLNSMGSRCIVQVRNGDMYSGLFHTASPQMDIVLSAAHKIGTNSSETPLIMDSNIPLANEIINELIFQLNDIVHMEIQDLNLNFAEIPVKSNGDSGADTKIFSSNGSGRQLELWDGGGDSPTDTSIGGLEDGLTTGSFNTANGWRAEDMFRTNQEQYGVKSSYNPDMLEYTTPLENENTAEFEKRKARADKIAHEIENSSNYIKNINLEVDESITEEEKFSAVVRDSTPKYPRGRGRPRDPVRNQRPSHGMYQQGPGSMVRPTGPYGSGRSNTPTFPGDSPTSPPGQGRNFSKLGNQSNLPPRLNRNHPRESGSFHDDRNIRSHDHASHHSTYSNQKPSRQTNQARGGYPKASMTPDYNPHIEGPPLSGQNTPQSVSRGSSTSSLNQQPMYHQWKEDERMPPGGAATTTNPQLSRTYPSPGLRGERFRAQFHKVQVIPRILNRPSQSFKQSEDNTFPSSVPSGGPVLPDPAMAAGPAPYLDKNTKQPHPGYRPGISPTGNAQSSPRLLYTPKGHSPPVGNMVISPMLSQPGQLYRQPPVVAHQQSQQQRYPIPPSTVATTISNPPAAVALTKRRSAEAAGKTSSTTKLPTSVQPMTVSKSNSTGNSKEITTQELKDFKDNFVIQFNEAPANESTQAKTTSSSGNRSKSMDESPASRPPPAAVQLRTPAASSNTASDLPSAPTPQATANTLTSRPPLNAGDVVTVSAAVGPFVASTEQMSTPANSQKPASDPTPSSTEPPIPSTTPTADQVKLNPDAKEFTPRSFSAKSSGTVTPQSPTPVPQQQVQGTFYNPPGQILAGHPPMYFLPPKPSMPKQGILSPAPTDQSVMINSQFHPNHIIPSNPYPPAPLVFAQTPHGQPIPTGQHALVHQQGYSQVDQMIYTPPPSHMVATAHRTISYPVTEYQQSHSIQIQQQQQQHPSPQHQPQPAVTPQQAQSGQQPTNYMNQQQPQQRPHSAHTPNPGLVRSASPATNVQSPAVSVNHSVALHHPNPNPVIAQHGYFQQPILAQHGLVSNNPHTPYQLQPRYMVVPQNAQQLPGTSPGGQSGYVSTVVTNPTHNQNQYAGRRQYPQSVIPNYQQPAPN